MSDKIISHPSTDSYRSGYDAIFGNKQDKQREMLTGTGCAAPKGVLIKVSNEAPGGGQKSRV